MQAKEAREIVGFVREIVVGVAPDANEKAMYGGIVFELGHLTPKRLFCGAFVRKEYVTVEFDRGVELRDPKGFLEGIGKYRRHIKVRAMSDVQAKDLEGFINQSFRL
jgi:hypothetical protein